LVEEDPHWCIVSIPYRDRNVFFCLVGLGWDDINLGQVEVALVTDAWCHSVFSLGFFLKWGGFHCQSWWGPVGFASVNHACHHCGSQDHWFCPIGNCGWCRMRQLRERKRGCIRVWCTGQYILHFRVRGRRPYFMDDVFGNALNLGCWVWCQWFPVVKDCRAWLHSWGRGIKGVKELEKLAVDFFQLPNCVR